MSENKCEKMAMSENKSPWEIANEKLEKIRKIMKENPPNKLSFEGCCVCYDATRLKTKCNHAICESCVSKLKSSDCPMCRADISYMTSLVFKYNVSFCEQLGLDPYGRHVGGEFHNLDISHLCPNSDYNEDGDYDDDPCPGPSTHMQYNGKPAINLYIQALKGYPLCDMIYLGALRDRHHMFHEFTYSCNSDKEELIDKTFGICLGCKNLKELICNGLRNKNDRVIWCAWEFCKQCIKPIMYDDYKHLFEEE